MPLSVLGDVKHYHLGRKRSLWKISWIFHKRWTSTLVLLFIHI